MIVKKAVVNISSHHDDDKVSPQIPPPSLSRRDAFINSKCPPPLEIAVVKKRKPFSFGKQKRHDEISISCPVGGVLGSSGRSIASSITDTDHEDVYEDNLDDVFATALASAPFNLGQRADNRHLDLKPFIPKRQKSDAQLSIGEMVVEDQEDTNAIESPSSRSVCRAVIDSPPVPPRRSWSFTSNKEGPTRSSPQHKPAKPTPARRSLPELPFSVPHKNSKSEVNIPQLAKEAAQFYAIMVQEVKDHKIGTQSYEKCFVGSVAVDRMVENGLAQTRVEAVALGRDLMKTFSLCRHASSSDTFRNTHALYRFWDGEQAESQH